MSDRESGVSSDLTVDQWTAQALGLRHFAVQHDVAFTAPDLPPVAYPEGFQGNNIPLNGAVVAKLAHRRLMLEPDSADDF